MQYKSNGLETRVNFDDEFHSLLILMHLYYYFRGVEQMEDDSDNYEKRYIKIVLVGRKCAN